MTTKLEIYVGNRHLKGPIASCSPNDLLSTLRSRDVWYEIKDSMTRVQVTDADTEEELASIWYDASTAHEEGEDWGTLSAELAASVEAALA